MWNNEPNSMTVGENYTDYLRRTGQLDDAMPEIPKWNDLEWEQGELLDILDGYERTYIMRAETDRAIFEGSGWYCCGELVIVEDIEIIKIK